MEGLFEIIQDSVYPTIRYKNDYRRKPLILYAGKACTLEIIKRTKKQLTKQDIKLILKLKK